MNIPRRDCRKIIKIDDCAAAFFLFLQKRTAGREELSRLDRTAGRHQKEAAASRLLIVKATAPFIFSCSLCQPRLCQQPDSFSDLFF